jgi:hypothetical protein
MTCSVPLREEHTVRVLRLVFGLKNDKVTANFVTDTLYYSGRPKEVEGVVCGKYGREHKMHYSVLVGKTEGMDCLNGWTTLKWIAQM